MAKNAILAAVLSLVLPGLGEIYIGKLMMGIILVILAIILLVAVSLTGYAWILYIILWLYAIYDSYTGAKATKGSLDPA